MGSLMNLPAYPRKNRHQEWGLFSLIVIVSISFLIWKWLQPLDFWFWSVLGFVCIFVVWAASLALSDATRNYGKIAQIPLTVFGISLGVLVFYMFFSLLTSHPFYTVLAFTVGVLIAIELGTILYALVIEQRQQAIPKIRNDVGVMIRVLVPKSVPQNEWLAYIKKHHNLPGFQFIKNYRPIIDSAKIRQKYPKHHPVLLRGWINRSDFYKLKRSTDLKEIWRSGPVVSSQDIDPTGNVGSDLNYIALHIGAKHIWNHHGKGAGVVIGVVDSGVRGFELDAHMKKTNGGYDGWVPLNCIEKPGDPSYKCHGTVMAYTALGICPEAKILDIGVGRKVLVNGVETIPDATVMVVEAIEDLILQGGKVEDPVNLKAMQERIKNEGPHVLLISWTPSPLHPEIERMNTDDTYPYVAKILEAIQVGVFVCMCASDCGTRATIPHREKCCGDQWMVSPYQIIGPNGHPDVITVGGCNFRDDLIGTSSNGPSILAETVGAHDIIKPDIVAPTRFANYLGMYVDGTSVSNAVVAGVLGLLRSKNPDTHTFGQTWGTQTPGGVQGLLQRNAWSAVNFDPENPECHPMPNYCWGYGIVNAKAAYCQLCIDMGQNPPQPPEPNRLYDSMENEPAGWVPVPVEPQDIIETSDGCNRNSAEPVVQPCGCFLATASYGSHLAPQVQFLRNYRDSVVLHSSFRPAFQRILSTYYIVSPPLAKRMQQSGILKKLIKYCVVYPVINIIKSLVWIRKTISHKIKPTK